MEDCESLFLEVEITNKLTHMNKTYKKLLLGCIYRHPRKTLAEISNFSQQMYKTLDQCSNIPLVLFGDINVDTLEDNEPSVQNYTNMLSSTGCQNLIHIPTCFSETSRSALDHVITNIEEGKIQSAVINHATTDHMPVFAMIKTQTNGHSTKNAKDEDITWQFINDKKKDEFIIALTEKLTKIDLNNHPEQMLADLVEATQSIIDNCFPEKKLSNRERKRAQTPWFDCNIFKEEKTQSRLFRRFIKSNDPADHRIYKTFRKKLSKKKYKAKRAYFRKLLSNAKNSEDKSATWKVINKIFGRKDKTRVYPDKVTSPNQSDKSDPKHIANALNGHFASVAKKLAAKLPKTNINHMSYTGKENKSSMYLKKIELREIIEIITNMSLKKAMGYDKIPPKIIKWAPEVFAPILLVIFNKCFDQGYYPDIMKVGKVSPIYKKGERNENNNYRPITVLTQFNQIFERLISKRLQSFFDKFELFTKKQFGFLKKHCTEHAILDLKECIIKNLEKKEVTAVLFLDLQKAFDTVNHDILLQKLHHYGVRGNAHKLLSSYLSGRKQFTKVRNAASELASILWGVPQGSILGPILFLIFINDLPNASELSSWLFADDTALEMSSKNVNNLERSFNYEVSKVQDWLLANRLSVHYEDKTQYMLIYGPNLKKDETSNFRLIMGGNQIERTKNYKYLGITIDDKLNWKVHINELCSKLATVCGVLSKVRHYLDRKSLLLIYHALFESRMRYAILGWGTASEHDLSKVKVLQNRAVRFITFSSFRTSSAPLFSKLKILPFQEILFLQRAIFMHNLHYKNLPFVLSVYCHQPDHRYSTRYATSLNYVLPPTATNRGQASIKFTGPKAWAKVPKHLKEVAFRRPFSKKLKEYVLAQIFVDLPTKELRKNIDKVKIEELKEIFQAEDDLDDFLVLLNMKTTALKSSF